MRGIRVLYIVLFVWAVVLVGGCGPSAENVLVIKDCPPWPYPRFVRFEGYQRVIANESQATEEVFVSLPRVVVKVKYSGWCTPSICDPSANAEALLRLSTPGIPTDSHISHVKLKYYCRSCDLRYFPVKGQEVFLRFGYDGELLGVIEQSWGGWFQPLGIDDCNVITVPAKVGAGGDRF